MPFLASWRPIAASLVAAAFSSAENRIPSGDHTVEPPYSVDPALTELGNPAGRYFSFLLETNQSRIFNGTSPTFVGAECHGPTPGECCHKASSPGPCEINWERNVTVYIPAAYRDGDAAPVFVIQDGPAWLAQVAFALDNLSPTASPDPANRSLPAFIAIAVENGGSDAIKSERGLEYDTMSDRYARFIAEEVFPSTLSDGAIRSAYPNLAFSTDPDQRATFGCSSGAAAALTMAWFRPDLFRRIAAYSATLVDQQARAVLTTPMPSLSHIDLLYCRTTPTRRVPMLTTSSARGATTAGPASSRPRCPAVRCASSTTARSRTSDTTRSLRQRM